MTSDMHPVAIPRDSSNAIAFSGRVVGIFATNEKRAGGSGRGRGRGEERDELKVRTTLAAARVQRLPDLRDIFSSTMFVASLRQDRAWRRAWWDWGGAMAGGQRGDGSVVRVDEMPSPTGGGNAAELQPSTSLSRGKYYSTLSSRW